MKFTIPLDPKTKKNGSNIIKNRKTHRYMITPSKYYKEYEKACKAYMPSLKTITEPINIKAVFYRKTLRRVDLVNLEQALLDILVKYKVIEDDNSNIVKSMDGSRVEHDKGNPRTEITITKI